MLLSFLSLVALLPWSYAQTLATGDSRNIPASTFHCDGTMSVSFASLSLNVRCGTEVPYQAMDNTGGPDKMPMIKWAGPGGASDLFTIIIVDRDAPNATTPNLSPIRHMAIANVPYGLLKAGFDSSSSVPTALFAYAKPGPPAGSGCHRYYVLLYKQNPGVTPSLSVPSSADPTNRRVWDFPSWAASNGLVGPISVNFWQTQNINTTTSSCPDASPAVNANRKFVKPLTQFPGFRTVMRTGQIVGNSLPLGTNVDKMGKPIAAATAAMVCNTNNTNNVPICYVPGGYNASDYEISVNPDFTSYLTTANGNVYMLAQFEANTPSTLYVVKIAINPVSGKMFAVWAKPVDFSAPELMGLWIPCAGSVSPWKSHLGSEEYEPDAYCIATATSFNGPEATAMSKCAGSFGAASVMSMMRYFFPHGNFTINDVKNTSIFNPYMYGHAVEVQLKDNDGGVNVFKHMALGRHSYELYLVMPDNKTVYSTDDGTNTGMWKFVANTAGDLSSGTLYGAKLTQTHDTYGGDFAVTWIELGKSSTTEILTMIKTGTTFLDIFEVSAWNTTSCTFAQATATPDLCCPTGFKSLSKRDNNLGPSCLKLKAGMEKAAAFLESRRYLAYMGGTVELSKFEGLTIDPINKKLYGAMSQNRYGMEDFKSKNSASNTYDIGGPNHVKVAYNPCGCVYAFDLSATWDVTRMYGEICGTPVTIPSRFSSTIGTKVGNQCLDLSEPDNVIYIPGHNMLIIGEDQNENQFDYMYQYDLATKTKTRIFSTNYGAETTAPYWFPDLKAGWSYLGAAIQHPYGESDTAMATAPGNTGRGGWIGNWAFRHSDFADGSMLRFLPIPEIKDNVTGHYATASASGYAVMYDNLYTKVQN